MTGIRNFIELVTGPGTHIVAYPAAFRDDPSRSYMMQFFKDDALETAAFVTSNQNKDLYFTIGTYAERTMRATSTGRMVPSRVADHVSEIRSFVLDVDFKQYESPEACKIAVRKFLKVSPLPAPTAIVATGGGLHVYWCMAKGVPVPVWSPVANGLADCAVAFNLECDTGVTRDAARVLRIPGSRNHKYEDKPVCEVLTADGPLVTLEQMQEVLSRYIGESPQDLQLPDNVRSIFAGTSSNSDLSAGVESGAVFEGRKVVEACPVMRDSHERGGAGDPYPLWKNVLHVLAFAEDGEELAHEVSERHKGYREAETTARFEESVKLRQEGRSGPTTCQTFSQMSPLCKTCPHFGSIKTPLVLGRAGRKDKDDVTFVRDGYTYVSRKVNDEWKDICIARAELTDFDLGHDWQSGRYLTFKVKGMAGSSDVRVPMSRVADNRALMALLLSEGVPVVRNLMDIFGSTLVSWMEKLQRRRSLVATQPFGWDDSGGFSLVGWRHAADGVTERAGVCDPGTLATYKPSGDYDTWRNAANEILKDQRPEVHAMVAVAFGSPLLKWTEVQAFAFSSVSRGSGHGKTTIMHLAQSVWGDPIKGLYSLNDTVNAITGKMSQTRYMPTFWDELRGNSDMENFVKVLFRANMGKERQRMNARAEIRAPAEINTLILAASNSSIAEAAVQHTAPSPAGIYRMLQMEMPTVSESGIDPADVRQAANTVKAHYGHAGVQFIAAVLKNPKSAEATVAQCVRKVHSHFNATAEERFWAQSLACLLAGALIARNAGICDLDITKVWDIGKRMFASHRAIVERIEQTHDRAPSTIVSHFGGNVVVIDAMRPGKGASPRVVATPPMRVGKLYVYVRDRVVFIPDHAVKSYSDVTHRPVTDIHNAMRKNGGKRRRMVPGAGTDWASALTEGWELPADTVLGEGYLDRWSGIV